jgi:hypothetical protein
MFAFGTTLPVASDTTPVSVANMLWENDGHAPSDSRHRNAAEHTNLLIITITPSRRLTVDAETLSS